MKKYKTFEELNSNEMAQVIQLFENTRYLCKNKCPTPKIFYAHHKFEDFNFLK